MNLKQKIKEWMLPIAMVTGASVYLLYHIMPEPVHAAGPVLKRIVDVAQPLMIFTMLFLTFCRIEPKELKPHRWHWWLLLIQGGLFTLLGLLAAWIMRTVPEGSGGRIILMECAMLCLITPTATAAAVVTRKLGGDVPGLTTYIVLINLLVAALVPLIVPLVRPNTDLDFWESFSLIMSKVFPLLITPCLCAWLVRYLAPTLHARLLKHPDLPFYIWAVALTLAIAVTTRSIVHTNLSAGLLLLMSLVSLICCAFQFAAGRYIGGHYKPRQQRIDSREVRKVTAGQAMGQKNTIFLIWMALTFMTPETAIVGGLYSVWHNLYNSWQLYRAARQ
jgi:BASS family bile acid:Na+ symporter